MTQLTFHNGTKALLIGVPKDAYSFQLWSDCRVSNNWIIGHSTRKYNTGIICDTIETNICYGIPASILGTFSPPSELTFEVKEEWVTKHPHSGKYGDDLNESYPMNFTKEQSFISYLQSEITKANLKEKKFVVIEIKL